MRRLRRVLLWLGGLGFAVGLAAAAAAGLYALSLLPELPSAETISHIPLKEPLRIYTLDGRLIGEYGNERRSPVDIAEVPQTLIDAVLAAEDDSFYSHPGVDLLGVARAAIANFRSGATAQGASTITMQVARNFFLTPEKTYRRKLKEILLAFRLESTLSKDKILELYLNKIFLGHRAYGFAAASRVYYGRTLEQLVLHQHAMLAGLPKAPSRNNPLSNPYNATQRRNYVLRRMHELGRINTESFEAAIAAPVTAYRQSAKLEAEATYVAEMARQEVLTEFGESVYESGLKVYVTIDSRLQKTADTALRAGLMAYDQRHGYRGAPSHRAVDPGTPVDRLDEFVEEVPASREIVPAVVIEVEDKEFKAYRDGSVFTVPWEAMDWARPYVSARRSGAKPERAGDIVTVGDVVYLMPDPQLQWRMTQIPAISGALISLNPKTGAINALSGGFDYYFSKFNRATQAQRQPGSNIKPFIYSAALEYGFTPASLISGAPIVVEDVAQSYWRPENYSGKFFGPTPLRKALSLSMNLVSVRLLRAMGIESTRAHIARFGFDEEQLPGGMSLALGAASFTPAQVATAFSAFANGGYRVEPYLIERIEDQSGAVVRAAFPPLLCTGECESPAPGQHIAPRVISAANAFVMTSMLQQVVKSGTARRALSLERSDLAGKTGTTNDFNDAWFSGFSPDVVTTVWTGFDQPGDLGKSESGAKVALPVWIDFMRVALEGRPDTGWTTPDSVVSMRVNEKTGEATAPGDPDGRNEYFIAGTEPSSSVGAVPSGRGLQGAGSRVNDDLF